MEELALNVDKGTTDCFNKGREEVRKNYGKGELDVLGYSTNFCPVT
jgi:hypothetical protein